MPSSKTKDQKEKKSHPKDFLDDEGKWICISCGDCCRFITHAIQSGLLDKEFDRGDGTCRHLKDNGCEIYDKRPWVCRTENIPSSDLQKAKACAIVRNLVNDKD